MCALGRGDCGVPTLQRISNTPDTDWSECLRIRTNLHKKYSTGNMKKEGKNTVQTKSSFFYQPRSALNFWFLDVFFVFQSNFAEFVYLDWGGGGGV